MNSSPIRSGSGWVSRVRSLFMIVTKPTPVSARTRSANGWSLALGSGERSARRTSGESASVAATDTTSSLALRSTASAESSQASTAAAPTSTLTSTS